MHWSKKMYFGERIDPIKDQIMQSIKEKKPCFDIYLLVRNDEGGESRAEIYHNTVLHYLEKILPNASFTVFGIARGKLEAFRLITQIVDERMQRTGDTDILEDIDQGVIKW